MTSVYEDFNQVVDQEKKILLGVSIIRTKLDVFKVLQDGTLVDNYGVASQGEEV